jgi:hypothetical protein
MNSYRDRHSLSYELHAERYIYTKGWNIFWEGSFFYYIYGPSRILNWKTFWEVLLLIYLSPLRILNTRTNLHLPVCSRVLFGFWSFARWQLRSGVRTPKWQGRFWGCSWLSAWSFSPNCYLPNRGFPEHCRRGPWTEPACSSKKLCLRSTEEYVLTEPACSSKELCLHSTEEYALTEPAFISKELCLHSTEEYALTVLCLNSTEEYALTEPVCSSKELCLHSTEE